MIPVWAGTLGLEITMDFGTSIQGATVEFEVWIGDATAVSDTWTGSVVNVASGDYYGGQYTTQATELDTEGLYRIQPKVTTAGGSIFYVDPIELRVLAKPEVSDGG